MKSNKIWTVIIEGKTNCSSNVTDHIVAEIQNLQMKDANLEISFQPLETPTIEGIEFVEFLISPNKENHLKV